MRHVPDHPCLDNDGPVEGVMLFSKKNNQLDIWQKEESKSEKLQFIAFNKSHTKDPMVWFLRKDKLNRSPMFQALFFGRESTWIPEWNDVQEYLPYVKDAREMYHLLHWINRDSLVFPCVLSLNRCYELATKYQITNNEVLHELETLRENKFELVLSYIGYEASVLETFKSKEEALIAKQNKNYLNPNFSLFVRERDDDKPFNK